MLDTHCHLDRYPDPVAVANDAYRRGVFLIAVTNLPSHFQAGLPHVKSLSGVRLALGLHPLAADHHVLERALFERLFAETSFIGEVGLDFSREGKATADVQFESFRFIAKLLASRPKFVTLHSRGAERDLLGILKEFGVTRAVFHWYSGPLSHVDDALNDGHYFSINPAMTRSESGRKIIARLPLTAVLTETDGPYVKVSGKPAKPEAVGVVENYLAELWGKTRLEIRALVHDNFRRIFVESKLSRSLNG